MMSAVRLIRAAVPHMQEEKWGRIINITKPATRVYYNLQEIGRPNLTQVLDVFVKDHGLV